METRTPKKRRRYLPTLLRIEPAFRQLPCIYYPARLTKQRIEYIFWRLRVYYRKSINHFNFDAIFWVSPNSITLCTPKEFSPFRNDGLVLDGDWDITQKKFNDLDVFIAFQQHFLDHAPWQSTVFYSNIIEGIKNRKEYPWGCRSESEFLKRCEGMDVLFEKIKKNGYQEQTKISDAFIGINKIDEISVNLSRNGELLFNNGAHRLSIAKILQLRKVPVRVTVTHKQCLNFNILKE